MSLPPIRLPKAVISTLPKDQSTAYRLLSTKRKNGSLTSAEHHKLLELSDVIETLHARRVQSLISSLSHTED